MRFAHELARSPATPAPEPAPPIPGKAIQPQPTPATHAPIVRTTPAYAAIRAAIDAARYDPQRCEAIMVALSRREIRDLTRAETEILMNHLDRGLGVAPRRRRLEDDDDRNHEEGDDIILPP